MKRRGRSFRIFLLVIVFVATLTNATAILHESELRTFTSDDGRALEARLDHYNPASEVVTLRTVDGSKYDLPLARISKKDQEYCLEWRKDYDASFVRVDFFANRIEGGRIVFMLDSSGSMDGDRWEKMVRNMSDVIGRMDSSTEFNVILFGSTATPFEADLVLANEEGKRRAVSWLNSLYPSGGTNLLSAIETASSMEKARVYAILSDGYPSSDVRDIHRAIIENRKRNQSDIKVYTVSYYASDRGQDFLKDLAERFGGGFVRR